MKVDVAINVFGKPYQTAITLLSLLEHSGQHIDKIYFTEERQKNQGDSVDFIQPWFGDNLVYYKPMHYLGVSPGKIAKLRNNSYRLSVRYQYAWEKTNKKYLFVTHNDCLYSSDIIGGMLNRIGGENCAGVGSIGQCWNCPASHGNHCDGDRFANFKPTYAQALAIVGDGYVRTMKGMIDPANPMPFPECRLNDFACLLNVELLRKEIFPEGGVVPYGFFGLDIGTDWFRALALKGYTFVNWLQGMEHAWLVPERNGHSLDAPNKREAYFQVEARAREFLNTKYPNLHGARY